MRLFSGLCGKLQVSTDRLWNTDGLEPEAADTSSQIHTLLSIDQSVCVCENGYVSSFALAASNLLFSMGVRVGVYVRASQCASACVCAIATFQQQKPEKV